jgi:Flp pilus assembly protein CpaB
MADIERLIGPDDEVVAEVDVKRNFGAALVKSKLRRIEWRSLPAPMISQAHKLLFGPSARTSRKLTLPSALASKKTCAGATPFAAR